MKMIEIITYGTIFVFIMLCVGIVASNVNSLVAEVDELNSLHFDDANQTKLKNECRLYIENMSDNLVIIKDLDLELKGGITICSSVVGYDCTSAIGNKKSFNSDLTYNYIVYKCNDVRYYKINMNNFIDSQYY